MARNLRMTEEAYAARMKRVAKPQAELANALDKLLKREDKPTKYRNVKTEVDGIKFDSKREAKRYTELLGMQKLGLITDLKRQVKYELIPSLKRADGTTERPVTYTLDFTYRHGDELICEDSKGMKTQQGIIRRKLMLFIHGITVREV